MRNALLSSTSRLTDTLNDAGGLSPPTSGGTTPTRTGDCLLTAKESADFLNISIAGFWRNVCNLRLPPPVYPAPRAPRWWASELRARVNATASLPADAKAARREARLARLRAAKGQTVT